MTDEQKTKFVAPNVRFGSKADIGLPAVDVRFTPKSGIAQRDNDVR